MSQDVEMKAADTHRFECNMQFCQCVMCEAAMDVLDDRNTDAPPDSRNAKIGRIRRTVGA